MLSLNAKAPLGLTHLFSAENTAENQNSIEEKKRKEKEKSLCRKCKCSRIEGDCTGEPEPSVKVWYEDFATLRVPMKKPGRTTRLGSMREE